MKPILLTLGRYCHWPTPVLLVLLVLLPVVTFAQPSATPMKFEYTSMPIKKDGQVVGAVVTFRDITERNRMEQEILNTMEKAEEATRAKSDFLANTSHEIRTPMNAVIGMSHLALKIELTLKQQDYFDIPAASDTLKAIAKELNLSICEDG